MKTKKLSQTELIDWIRLSRSVGSVTFYSLMAIHKDAEKALQQLKSVINCSKKRITIPSVATICEEIEKTEKIGAQLIASCDPLYSSLLRQVRNNPPVITVLGNTSLLNKQTIAIVGSRNANINICNLTASIALELGKNDFNIASGLAVGIDSAAHSIINHDLPTTAVTATGIDIIYPTENTALYNKIATEGGLIMTEFPLGTYGKRSSFPMRNRIISGLSECVVVASASEKSGAMLTAQYALEQGRKLFAIPGFPMNLHSKGCNLLIKSGATIVESAQDIIESLSKTEREFYDGFKLWERDDHLSDDACETPMDLSIIPSIKRLVLSKLSETPVPMNELLASLGVDNKHLLSAIVELEIEGKIIRSISDDVSLLY